MKTSSSGSRAGGQFTTQLPNLVLAACPAQVPGTSREEALGRGSGRLAHLASQVTSQAHVPVGSQQGHWLGWAARETEQVALAQQHWCCSGQAAGSKAESPGSSCAQGTEAVRGGGAGSGKLHRAWDCLQTGLGTSGAIANPQVRCRPCGMEGRLI